mmetsp:Transcript_49434/g.92490  ORF Transcript_49434/g.92490 Transcript_49434/m.92490 type:complete len:243 (-) Transcript_49434:76-804(-)
MLPVIEQPLSSLDEVASRKLRYIGVCVGGMLFCATGRWLDGNHLGAINDALASMFGVAIYCEDSASSGCPSWCTRCFYGGLSCLLPFTMLAGVNCIFDCLSLMELCSDLCFRTMIEWQSGLCSGCFFTLAAVVFQVTGGFLSWQIHRSCSQYAYGDIQAMQRAVEHAGDSTTSTPQPGPPVEVKRRFPEVRPGLPPMRGPSFEGRLVLPSVRLEGGVSIAGEAARSPSLSSASGQQNGWARC